MIAHFLQRKNVSEDVFYSEKCAGEIFNKKLYAMSIRKINTAAAGRKGQSRLGSALYFITLPYPMPSTVDLPFGDAPLHGGLLDGLLFRKAPFHQ